MTPRHQSFLTWRDFVLTPLTGLFILGGAASAAWAFARGRALSVFALALLFYGAVVFLTLVFLAVLRRAFPPPEGEFDPERHPAVFYVWKLHHVLSVNLLFIHYQNSLLPPMVRKFFSRLMGAKVGRGLVTIAGHVLDPYLIEIGENAIVGQDALLVPASFRRGRLIQKKIRVGAGAVVGARTVVECGAVIGEGAMVKAMSLVVQGTVVPPRELWGGIPARKMGELAAPQGPPPFQGWRDLIVTPLVECVLLAAAGAATWALRGFLRGDLFLGAAVFYVILQAVTLAFLWLLRRVFPFPRGEFPLATSKNLAYLWSLHGFLCVTNLFIHYQNGILPPILRNLFARALGARVTVGRGMLSMNGPVHDPFLVTVEAGAVIGTDTLILGHAVTPDMLVLKPVTIRKGALIGPRSMIMPGVTVGEGARVEPMSLVTKDTQIGPGEVWGGIPARPLARMDPARAAVPSFVTARDVAVTAAVELGLLGLAGVAVWAAWLWRPEPFVGVVVFWAVLTLGTLAVLAAIRPGFADRQGILTEGSREYSRWKLYSFLCVNNLFLHYQNGLLPPILRRWFLRLLGARAESRPITSFGGTVDNPWLFSVSGSALVGHDSYITCLDLVPAGARVAPVRVGPDATLEARVVLLPGVTVGAGASVRAMSLVPAGSEIPAGETWAGVPARRIA